MAIRYKVTKGRTSYPGNINPLKYSKNRTVMSMIGLGIFLFRRRKDAEDYIELVKRKNSPSRLRSLRIIRVETIGKGRKLTLCPNKDQFYNRFKEEIILRMSRAAGYRSLNFAGSNDCIDEMQIWYCAPGTMVYPGVKVLT